MNLTQLLVYFETSPALKLLRSPNAPFIIDFLHRQFKASGQIALPHSELRAALIDYRESISENWPDSLRDKAETYLSTWCSEESRWLHRFLDASRDEPMYQLTRHSEDVFTFLDRVLEQDLGFVGTESRLKMVIDMLADIVVHASDDPQQRLEHLRREKQRLEYEIEQIEADGLVRRYRPVQIRERFASAVSLLRQLQGDFRAVEEKFKEITQQVQQRQTAGTETRGGILEFALESEDVLKKEDQGVSFYEFVRLILSPSQQERLQAIIEQLGSLRELAEQTEGMETVRRMIPSLLAEAEQVMRTNQRLSTTLRRMLDVRAFRDRRRVAQLLREVRQLASALAERPPADVGVEVEAKLEINSPFARTFWAESQRFANIELSEREEDAERRAEAFRALAELQRLDWQAMRRRVQESLTRHGSATLGELLSRHPPEAGVVEVLGYLQIARDDGHFISRDATEEIVLPSRISGERGLAVTMPLVRFVVT